MVQRFKYLNKNGSYLQNAIVGLFLSLSVNPLAWSTELELTTWWASPGESAALDVIHKEYQARGGELNILKLESLDSMRRYIASRASASSLPGVSQWLFGDELNELIDHDLIRPLTIDKENATTGTLYPELSELAAREDELWALPLGVHIHNSIFYNVDLYEDLELNYPRSWTEFIAQIPAFKNAGIMPLATSSRHWSAVYLFQAILLDIGGEETYRDLHNGQVSSHEQYTENIVEAAEVFYTIRATLDDVSDKDWTELVSEVARGDAAALVIGDFAHSEFLSLDQVPGRDYACGFTPNSGKTLIYGADTLVLFKTDDPEVRAAQDLLAEVVLDPLVQSHYIARKGGLPVRSGIPPMELDPCSATKIELWANPASSRLLSFSGRVGLRGSSIKSNVTRMWAEKNSAKWLSDRLLALDKK